MTQSCPRSKPCNLHNTTCRNLCAILLATLECYLLNDCTHLCNNRERVSLRGRHCPAYLQGSPHLGPPRSPHSHVYRGGRGKTRCNILVPIVVAAGWPVPIILAPGVVAAEWPLPLFMLLSRRQRGEPPPPPPPPVVVGIHCTRVCSYFRLKEQREIFLRLSCVRMFARLSFVYGAERGDENKKRPVGREPRRQRELGMRPHEQQVESRSQKAAQDCQV